MAEMQLKWVRINLHNTLLSPCTLHNPFPWLHNTVPKSIKASYCWSSSEEIQLSIDGLLQALVPLGLLFGSLLTGLQPFAIIAFERDT